MVLHFLSIAKRGIFDLVKMRESNLAFSVEKKNSYDNNICFCFCVEQEKISRARQSRDMEVFSINIKIFPLE